MLFLKKFFAPSEVKVCLLILDDIDKEVDSFMFPIIKPTVKLLLMDFDRVRYTILQDKMFPKNLVLMLLSNIVGDLISSGNFHVYRNVLSAKGKELLRIWNYIQSAMLLGKYVSQEEYDKDQKWLLDKIKSAG